MPEPALSRSASLARREALAYADALHSFARYLMRGDADAEDLVQETYARAFDSAARFAPGTNLKAWLFRILRNVFIDRHRREERSPVAAGAEPDDAPAPDGTLAVERLAAVDLEAALLALAEPARSVVLLDLEGFDEREIAEVVGCAPGTVKSRLSRARAALRRLLEDYAR
jgi:RNA polymerase sigma-70 factor (ECF subfamily)